MPGGGKTVKLHNPFVPKGYDLKISVDLDNWSYTATEEVTLQRAADYESFQGDAAACIQLHAAPSIQLEVTSGATLVTRDPEMHTLHLKLSDPKEAEPKVRFSFKHQINPELRGFYRVTFHHNGKEHRMASTHFEPTSARLFYVCQDEPASRADFSLTVTLPASREHYTVLSNGPLKSKARVAGKEEVQFTFETIPKCPPYLTACVIGELECVSGKAAGIPVSVYCSIGKSGRAKFALETTCFAVEYFTKFFQHGYPLPKLDVVAVPDFPIGGMENWGTICCVESILIEEGKASVAAQKRASELLCHEVSHNWFGNLVNIAWWEGLWLKEGFASWCGNHASHVRFPSWGCLQDAAEDVSAAMDMDSFEHSHPVEVPIRDPAEVTEIFDGISYDKGMGLVFMLEAFLGSKWSDAVAHYINKHAWGATRTVQLWEALEESSGQPVREAMTSFTTQMGYPIIHVERTAPNRVVLRQEPCKVAPSRAASESTSVWCVPVVISGRGEARTTAVVRSRDPVEVELPAGMATAKWLTANPERAGFYRCRYDDATFAEWIANYPKLGDANASALVSDTFAAVRMGYDDVDRLVRVAAAVREHEESMCVLRQFATNVSSFAAAMEDGDVAAAITKAQFAPFVRKANAILAKPVGDAVSDEEELRRGFILSTALAQVLRENSSASAAPPEQKPIIDWALAEAHKFLSGKPCSRATLPQCLAAYARLEESEAVDRRNDALFARFQESDGDDELCRAAIYGLCMSQDTAFVKSIASRCMVGDKVRPHFGGNVFMAMSTNTSFKANELWDFFKANIAAVDEQWGGGQFRIQVIVKMVAKTLSGDAAADDYASFFAAHPLPNARLEIGRATEGIRLRSWLNCKWCTAAVTKRLFV